MNTALEVCDLGSVGFFFVLVIGNKEALLLPMLFIERTREV